MMQAARAQARAQSLAAKLKAHRRSSGESALLLQVETLQEDKRSAEAQAEGLRLVRHPYRIPAHTFSLHLQCQSHLLLKCCTQSLVRLWPVWGTRQKVGKALMYKESRHIAMTLLPRCHVWTSFSSEVLA